MCVRSVRGVIGRLRSGGGLGCLGGDVASGGLGGGGCAAGCWCVGGRAESRGEGEGARGGVDHAVLLAGGVAGDGGGLVAEGGRAALGGLAC